MSTLPIDDLARLHQASASRWDRGLSIDLAASCGNPQA